MSPFPLLMLILGIVHSRVITIHDDNQKYQPFISRAQETRICTELCASGLGGTPCGDQCTDLVPENLPPTFSSTNSNLSTTNFARQAVCPILCDNDLGYPLCQCIDSSASPKDKKVDFENICSSFCVMYDYELYGCQSCQVYMELDKNQKLRRYRGKTSKIDWEGWCKLQCAANNGGAACNCDILPMRFSNKKTA